MTAFLVENIKVPYGNNILRTSGRVSGRVLASGVRVAKCPTRHGPSVDRVII